MYLAPIPSKPLAMPRILVTLIRMPRLQAWTLVLVLAELSAIGDYFTGPSVWFGPAYLIVMCVAAWAFGWKVGQAVGISCMVLTFGINGISLYPYASSELLLNLALRFVAVSVIIVVVAAMRRTFVREWFLARTDVLTGAFNRQAFFELSAELCRQPAWRLLLYADLDGLKRINDEQGHAAGDNCLMAYAQCVRAIIRQDDIFARVGGDEFLIFMTVRDEAAAVAVAERLHSSMNDVCLSDGSAVRCSVGALAIPPGENSIDELVRRADNLMYQAKLAGAELRLAESAASQRPLLAARTAGRRSSGIRRRRPHDRRS